MKVFCIGLDFRTAPLELRAKVASKDPSMVDRLATNCAERLLLSTCNRSEVYGVGEESEISDIVQRWSETSGLREEERRAFQVLRDQECVAHLFRVVAGMESMVVGEAQINGQVKRAYEDGIRNRTVGSHFHRIFQRSFKVAKKIRAQTEVGRFAVSIPSIGVKLAESVLGSLSSRTVGIIGLGEIGRVAAEYFGSTQPEKLLLYNRTLSTALEIEGELQKEGVNAKVVQSYKAILKEASVIVSAVDTQLISERDLQSLDRRGNPLFVLDLAVPPSVEKVGLADVFMYGVDDLQKIAAENSQLREQEVVKAERMIQEEASHCWAGIQISSVNETFNRLAQKMESLTADELVELKKRLPHLKDGDWAEIEKMAIRLTSKWIQDPMTELKSQLQTAGESESLVQFFRNIFRI